MAQNKKFKKFFSSWKNIFKIGKGMSMYVTKKGEQLWIPIVGYKNYLETAEEDRIKFHSDPNNDNLYISEEMPYAVALGVNNKWINELMGYEKGDDSVDRI